MVKIIEAKTTQSSAIKILVDTLNSLLTDVNITFYPTQDTDKNNDSDSELDNSDSSEYESESDDSDSEKEKKISKKGGIIIKEVNKTITVLVYCKLDGWEEFHYNYHKSKLTIGVKLPISLNTLPKTLL